MTTITAERLREVLQYDPETGVFTHKMARGKGRVGMAAGSVGKRGYVDISLFCRKYKAHLLAWLYITGEWPVDLVDHRDSDKTNNRFINLRQATKSQNAQNSKPHKDGCGVKGVIWCKQMKKWRAAIRANGSKHIIGYFNSKELAGDAYRRAARLYFGEFARAA